MDLEHLTEIRNNDTLRKRLAKVMAREVFRDNELERLHSKPLSRLSNEEMEILMKDIVNHCYMFLSGLFLSKDMDHVIKELKREDRYPQLDDPEIPKKLLAEK